MRKGRNVYKRKDGRWEARVLIGRRADGCPQYKYLYGGTYRAALQKKEDFEKNAACQTREPVYKNALCFRDAAVLWLDDSRERWKPSSYVRYQDCLEKDILPQWGKMPLREIGQEDYDKLINGLKSRLKGSSINTINSILKGIIKYSLLNRHLEKSPFDLSYPSVKKGGRSMDILTAEEIWDITQYIDSHFTPLTLGILLALYEGIRLGELCALQWRDVDIEKGILHIRKTMQRLRQPSPEPGGPKTILHLGMPKNGRERTIPIHPAVLEILRNNQEECPKEYYLIRDHRPMEPRSFSRHFKYVLSQAGIRNLNFHTLRHTFASCCVEAGMDIKVLSEILGHSSVKITMDRYVHLSMQYKQSQLGNLELPVFPSINRQKNSRV